MSSARKLVRRRIPAHAMARPAARAARARILDAAIDGMRRRGLAGAALNEIVAAANAPKGSLYHYFPEGKDAIVCEAMGVYGERVREYIEQSLAGARSAPHAVRALLRAVAERLRQSGFEQSCAVGAVSLDVGVGDVRIVACAAGEFRSWIDVIESHLPIPDASRRRQVAGFVLTAIQGAYVRGRAERSIAPLLEAGDCLAALVAAMVAQPRQEDDDERRNSRTKDRRQ